MKLDQFNQWLIAISNVGILAGLILVGVQIRQEPGLTRVQIFSDATNTRIQMHEAMLGENPAAVVMNSLGERLDAGPPPRIDLGDDRAPTEF